MHAPLIDELGSDPFERRRVVDVSVASRAEGHRNRLLALIRRARRASERCRQRLLVIALQLGAGPATVPRRATAELQERTEGVWGAETPSEAQAARFSSDGGARAATPKP